MSLRQKVGRLIETPTIYSKNIFNCHAKKVPQKQHKNSCFVHLENSYKDASADVSVGQNEKCYGNSSQVEHVC